MKNERTSTCSPASEHGASLPSEPATFKQLDLLNVPSTPVPSSSDTGPMSQTLGISEKSLSRKQASAICSPPRHPANPTPELITIEATNQMTVSSGESCLTLLKTSGPLGSLVRRLVSSRSFTSTIFSMRWSPQGTPRGRLYFQLVPTEVAPTEGTDSGSWPTPTSRDWKDTGSLENVPEKGLLGRVFQNIFGMKLPPEFSEWLMGLPLGHTVVNGFKPLETQSPRPSRTKS